MRGSGGFMSGVGKGRLQRVLGARMWIEILWNGQAMLHDGVVVSWTEESVGGKGSSRGLFMHPVGLIRLRAF